MTVLSSWAAPHEIATMTCAYGVNGECAPVTHVASDCKYIWPLCAEHVKPFISENHPVCRSTDRKAFRDAVLTAVDRELRARSLKD